MALPFRKKISALRIFVLLGWYRAGTLLLSFKFLTRNLHQCKGVATPSAVTLEQLQRAKRLSQLVESVSQHTPWESLCLVQVLVIQRLLRLQGIPGQFYLGVRQNGPNGERAEPLAAHAWLQCGNYIVNGWSGHEQFTAMTTYRWGPGGDNSMEVLS